MLEPIASLACRSCNPLYEELLPCPLPYALRMIAILLAMPFKFPRIALIAADSLVVSGMCFGVISNSFIVSSTRLLSNYYLGQYYSFPK